MLSAYFENNLDRLKRSMWTIPFLMTILFLILAISLNYLDLILKENNIPLINNNWGINVQGIQSLFSNIAGAIITAMTTILSITLLVFTVLSGQYGAHVLRVFQIKSFSKFVIGWLSGTYAYLIYHIYLYSTGNSESHIPQISIIIGMLLTLGTLFLLIMYIHFLVTQIQIGTIASEITKNLTRQIKKLKLYESTKDQEDLFIPKSPLNTPSWEIYSKGSGYVQSLNKTLLKSIASSEDLVIYSLTQPGDFLFSNQSIFKVYGKNKPSSALFEKIEDSLILGNKRIPIEDLLSNLEVLIELALRALSPGINDLKVAQSCADFIGQSIALCVQREFPKPALFDTNNKLLVVTQEISFEDYLDAAISPLRQYSKKHISLSISLIRSLMIAYQINQNPAYKKPLEKHVNALYDSAMKQPLETLDYNEIEQVFKSFYNLRLANQLEI